MGKKKRNRWEAPGKEQKDGERKEKKEGTGNYPRADGRECLEKAVHPQYIEEQRSYLKSYIETSNEK